MKKFLNVLISLCLCLCLAFAFGCGDYSQDGTNKPIGGGDKDPVKPNPDGGSPFTVSLVFNDKKYIPDNGLKALWNDGMSFTEAGFDDGGVAKAGGLDGEYRVTLSGLSTKYTYNPNVYYANNDKRDVEIELYELGKTGKNGRGNGTVYNEHVINYDGYYRATFTTAKQAKDGIFFMYEPLAKGKYSVESIIDVTANEVNPILDIYVGNRQFAGTKETRDYGGASSNYTYNFRYDVQLESVGNIYRFAVRFDSRGDISLPVNIDFYVKYEGEVEVPDYSTELITDFDNFSAVDANVPYAEWNGTSEFMYAFIQRGGKKYLIGSKYGYNEEDGLWHVLNDDGSFGAVLLAYISKDSDLLQTDSTLGFMDGLVRCNNLNGKNYDKFVETYAGYCRAGRFPVTMRVKNFLQEYATSQRYFMDGRGWAEIHNYMSEEDDQWLFNCGYLV